MIRHRSLFTKLTECLRLQTGRNSSRSATHNHPFGERQQKSHLTPPTKQPEESKCDHSQMRAKLHQLTTHVFARTQRGVTSMRIPELSQSHPSRNTKSSLSIQRQLVRLVS